MRKRAAAPIGSVLAGVLREAEKQHGALQHIQQRWRHWVGKGVAEHARPVSMRGKRLVIHVDRPAHNFTLKYRREELLERVKAETKGKVQELVIRAGELTRL